MEKVQQWNLAGGLSYGKHGSTGGGMLQGIAPTLQYPVQGYAPELNPVEGIWQYLKRVRLGNVCCGTLREVRHELRLAPATLTPG